jgi:hypothetical protein
MGYAQPSTAGVTAPLDRIKDWREAQLLDLSHETFGSPVAPTTGFSFVQPLGMGILLGRTDIAHQYLSTVNLTQYCVMKIQPAGMSS